MLKKPTTPKLTKREIEVLIIHVRADLSYGAGGTFIAGDQNFDAREARIARRAIEKLQAMRDKSKEEG